MARVSHLQATFSRGVVSSKLDARVDLELFHSGLADGLNSVVTGQGILEKRPGTMFTANTKDDGEAILVPFIYSINQAYVLEFGDDYMRAFANYGQVLSGASPHEIATPYSVADLPDLSYTQSNDILFLVHGDHKPARLARVGVSTFALANFDTFDGPYEDMNTDPNRKLALSGTTLTASGTGFAPFTEDMIGRWVRIRTPNTDSPDPNVLGDEFLWDYFQITAVASGTNATVDASGTIAATADWRLGAFYDGVWPQQVALLNGRLVLSRNNRLYFSKPYDFNNFAPTQHAANSDQATGRVVPDSAITLELDSGLSQSGAISRIFWMRALNFQLVCGTPSGIFTIQSNSLGEGLTAENAVARFQDARGVSNVRPINVSDSLIFAHATGRRVQGTYYKDNAYDRIGAQDLSLPSDTLITDSVHQMTWQDYPHGVVWICLEDGRLLSLTLQPEENVQGWFPHELGGSFNNGGRVEHPHVESLCTIPSPDGKLNDLWMIAKRTINGQTVRFVEILRPFREQGEDLRNSWFLDAALRYDGNDDEGKTMAFTIPAEGPNVPWEFTTNFADPAFVSGQKLSIYDGTRWHRGTIIDVDEGNDFTWQPAAPNAPDGAADGIRWYWADWENGGTGAWIRLDADEKLIEPGTDRWIRQATYVPPRQDAGIWRWSIAINTFSGLDHLEGEDVQALLDGFPTNLDAVEAGVAEFGGVASVATVGLPMSTRGRLLPLDVGAQAGSAIQKQRPVYRMEMSVWETYGLEVGTGEVSSFYREWEHYRELVFANPFAEGEPPPVFTGYKAIERDEQGGDGNDNPVVAWRHSLPLPCTVRAVLVRISTSDGR